MKVPFVLALDMMDVARSRRIEVDTEPFPKPSGVQVVTLTASKGEGIATLRGGRLDGG